MIRHVFYVLGFTALVSACGGGSSGGGSTPPPASSASSAAGTSSSVSSSSVSSSSVSSSEASSSESSASSSVMANICGVATPVGTPTTREGLPEVKCILVDQFGYLPNANKIAILRDPRQGFDAELDYTPGASLSVVNADTDVVIFNGTATAWNNGAVNTTSGDQVWWFDFSNVTATGRYIVVDDNNHLRSSVFEIKPNIYRPVLIAAVRSFFYQRAGFAKQAPYAEPGWVDAASHLKPGQDTEARLYNATADATTARDLSGGWYDAGDYNKYTNWHADYLVVLMHTYLENPSLWTDDFNLPESGNGVPDLIDEIKWGMDWLIKMQEDNGSVLSVMGLSHASPPSSATGPSIYGPATTSATLTSAGAFALGARFFAALDNEELTEYADALLVHAQQAWQWADENPGETFHNTGLVAAGEQEVDDAGRAKKARTAAAYLFAATGEANYRHFFDASYTTANPASWVAPWNERELMTLLFYAGLPEASTSIASDIKTKYRAALDADDNWPAITGKRGAYRAFLGDGNFTWGSNRTMASKGSSFYNVNSYAFGDLAETEIEQAALGYIHYIHGVNPLGKVYLSNMGSLGAEDSVDSFYHSWFSDGSADWDSVSASSYGPVPGFLVGGPNPSYNWDACCPDSCGSSDSNAACGMAPLSPPAGQPPAKSYTDFNTSWPVNSWQVTENHNDYQVAYIRLLSKFVD